MLMENENTGVVFKRKGFAREMVSNCNVGATMYTVCWVGTDRGAAPAEAQWNSLILIQHSPTGSERGLPFAQDGIRASRADAWNQHWEWMGGHWGAN